MFVGVPGVCVLDGATKSARQRNASGYRRAVSMNGHPCGPTMSNSPPVHRSFAPLRMTRRVGWSSIVYCDSGTAGVNNPFDIESEQCQQFQQLRNRVRREIVLFEPRSDRWNFDNGCKWVCFWVFDELGVIGSSNWNMVDLVGIEPTTSSMPWKRAPSCATGPLLEKRRETTFQFSPTFPGESNSSRIMGV